MISIYVLIYHYYLFHWSYDMCFYFFHKPILLRRAESHVFVSFHRRIVTTFLFHIFLITLNSFTLPTMADPLKLPLGGLDTIEVTTTLFAWGNGAMRRFDPPTCGNAIRWRSMIWPSVTNSYESYRGLPQSHMAKPRSPSSSSSSSWSFPSNVFCIWVSKFKLLFCIRFWFKGSFLKKRRDTEPYVSFVPFHINYLWETNPWGYQITLLQRGAE